MAPERGSTFNEPTACMSTDASINKQAFRVVIKMATPSLKEVQDGSSISHNIIIYHIPCFVVVYFFVNFGSTSALDDWNLNDCSFGQMLHYIERWLSPYMEVANRNACNNHTAYDSSQ